MERYGMQEQEAAAGLLSLLTQTFGSLESIRLHHAEPYFQQRFEQLQETWTTVQKRASDAGQIPRFAMEIFGVILAMGIMVLLVLSGRSFSETAALAAFFIGAMIRLMPGISRIHYNLLSIRHSAYLFSEICRDLNEPIKKSVLPSADGPLVFENALTVQNVDFSYGNTKVLKDFSMSVGRRESVLLTGKTGCGKTTLIHLICGFLIPSAGKILVDHTDITGHMNAWHDKIGYVPQQIFLLDADIRSNVAFGVPENEIDDALVRASLESAQVWDFVQSLPDGPRTQAGEGGAKLSGGQRQRIAIARALYRQPELLILDEATSALDDETERAFTDVLRNLRGKMAILMIAHHFRQKGDFDRAVEIPSGEK